ncbi:unnamed protein product [Ascophyllum nodosum]
MQQKGWPLSQALAEVRRAQPTVHINPGFVAQLALYQDLGCQLPGETYCATGDGINVRAGATYRWFLLACGLKKGLGSTHLRNSDVATSCPGDAFGSKETGARLRENQRKSAPEQEAPNVLKPSMFRCKTCRHPLFSEGNIIDHLHPLVRAASNSIYASFGRHGDGSSWLAAKNAAAAIQSGAREKNKDKALRSVRLGCTREGRADTFSGTSRGSCSSVFTEPLEWITKTDGTRIFSRGSFDTEGKITCPGVRGMGVVCGGKLGAWSLDGKDCSCGAKVKPAVQFTLSRIERERYG